MRSVVDFAIQPLNIILLLAVLTGILLFLSKQKWANLSFLVLAIILILSASDFIPDLLLNHLESRFMPFEFEALNDNEFRYILVLGSGHTADPDLSFISQLSEPALGRLTEGIRIHLQIPESQLILSGYGGVSPIPQAEVMAQSAIQLGVVEQDIVKMPEPTNTAEEADYYLERFGKDRSLILVTSASHMPRAMTIFRNRGLDPVPAPTFYYLKDDPYDGFDWKWFDEENFHKVEVALHEYVGMLWEKVRH